MNEKIATIISEYLTEDDEEISRIKIRYYIGTIMGEIEKCVLIMAMFAVWGRLVEIIVVLCVLLLLRPYLGGNHFSGYYKCLMYSSFICVIICILGKEYRLPGGCEIFIIMLLAAFVVIYAPVRSQYRPIYKGKRLIKMKVKGCLAVVIIILSYVGLEKYRNMILWATLVVLTDSIIACIRSSGSIIWKGGWSDEADH